MTTNEYPPAPWTLTGSAVGILVAVDRNVAAQFVPRGLKILPVWPGKTVGGLVLGSYGEGSTLAYHELVVFCGLVYHRGRLGGWISHIYVDHPASVAGGRDVWGLPKELADFRTASGAAAVCRNEVSLCRMGYEANERSLAVPLALPAWGGLSGQLRLFTATGRARASFGRADFEVPPSSPFSPLISSGLHKCIVLREVRLAVPAPRRLPRPT